jgi:hypothetical protein
VSLSNGGGNSHKSDGDLCGAFADGITSFSMIQADSPQLRPAALVQRLLW